MDLLAETLSNRGYEKVLAIVEGDEVLRAASGGRDSPMFGRDLFYISIQGKPAVKDPWMLSRAWLSSDCFRCCNWPAWQVIPARTLHFEIGHNVWSNSGP